MGYNQHNRFLKAVNSSVVTVIPKTPHPESVRHFRPIACCPTVYKVISKILSV